MERGFAHILLHAVVDLPYMIRTTTDSPRDSERERERERAREERKRERRREREREREGAGRIGRTRRETKNERLRGLRDCTGRS